MFEKIRKLKDRKGFTLVELIVVLVILAILAALLIRLLPMTILQSWPKPMIVGLSKYMSAKQMVRLARLRLFSFGMAPMVASTLTVPTM